MTSTPEADAAGRRSPFAHVGVIGCGLIGGSFALAARAVPGVERVLVHDADASVRERAQELGLEVVAEPAALAARSDLVVVAVPIASIGDVVAGLAERMDHLPVITDVGSTKSKLVPEVEAVVIERSTRPNGDIAPDPARIPYIGGHPMAGSEREGLEAADGTLFQGATYALTPTGQSDPAALRALSSFLRLLGCRVLVIDPDTHDRLVATVSHLPQVLASALVGSAGRAAESDPGVLALAGTAFRDVARVAGSNPELWVGILRENRGAVLEAIASFAEVLDELRGRIAAGEWEAVRDVLSEARAVRERLPSKEVAVDLVDLVIPVADRPGSLAEVTTALGGAGINIEDLSMRHAAQEELGALVVTLAAGRQADHAVEVLTSRGYACHLEHR